MALTPYLAKLGEIVAEYVTEAEEAELITQIKGNNPNLSAAKQVFDQLDMDKNGFLEANEIENAVIWMLQV